VPSEPLMATCWTTAGDAAPDRSDLRSPIPLRERIEAAARAGFQGFGLLSDDLPDAERAYGLPGIRSILADNGITHLELEGIPDWWAPDGRSDEIRRRLLRAAALLGARHI
jgi:sugar phosphate isomerase/epimerase